MTHPYKDILIAIANGEQIETKLTNNTWFSTSSEIGLADIAHEVYPPSSYRIKPKTIRIGEFDVPEPIYEGFINDHKYYYPDVFDGSVGNLRWVAGSVSMNPETWTGLLHATEKAAQIHLDALLSFTRRSA